MKYKGGFTVNVNGLGSSSTQNSVGSSSSDIEQQIKKLEQKKVKYQQDKAKADSPFSTKQSKESAEIDKKIKEIDKQIQQLRAKATTNAGNQKKQDTVKSNPSDKDQFDKLTRSNKQPDSDEKSISGVYNVKPDEKGSQEIVLTPFQTEIK